jgi:tellurite methyltransferase
MTNTPANPWGDRDWSTYYTAVAGKPPRDTLLIALDLFARREDRPAGRSSPHALDLGAGEGRDTRELLRQGFRVLALDPHPAAPDLLTQGLAPEHAERLTVVRAGTESLAAVLATRPDFATPDLINASFSFPFIPPVLFPRAWTALRAALAPGTLFAAQFFGPRDSWASNPTRTHHTREQVQHLLDGLTLHHLAEDDKPGHDAEGHPKHWHVFHVVAENSPSQREGAGGGFAFHETTAPAVDDLSPSPRA